MKNGFANNADVIIIVLLYTITHEVTVSPHHKSLSLIIECNVKYGIICLMNRNGACTNVGGRVSPVSINIKWHRIIATASSLISRN